MLSFDEAAALLDEACEALPQGLFDGLNGGVSLLPDALQEEDGRYTLGFYHEDMMGCWIEIFYGSVEACCEDPEDDEEFKEILVETLHHELRHHVEALAGDRSLEIEDEQETEEYRRDMELARFEPRTKKSGGLFSRLRRRNRPVKPKEDER